MLEYLLNYAIQLINETISEIDKTIETTKSEYQKLFKPSVKYIKYAKTNS